MSDSGSLGYPAPAFNTRFIIYAPYIPVYTQQTTASSGKLKSRYGYGTVKRYEVVETILIKDL